MKIGTVTFPLFAILAAVPKAIKAAAKVAADDHDAASPGGTATTAAEVMEAIGAFVATLGEAILPAVLKANGVKG